MGLSAFYAHVAKTSLTFTDGTGGGAALLFSASGETNNSPEASRLETRTRPTSVERTKEEK